MMQAYAVRAALADALLHAGVLIGYAAAGFYAAVVLTRRRMLT